MKSTKHRLVERITFQSEYGLYNLDYYEVSDPQQPNMKFAMVFTSNDGVAKVPIVRIHSECMLSEIFHFQHCDCREQLEISLNEILRTKGILFYLNQEGRGHGLANKIRELRLQEEGMDTVEASQAITHSIDERRYQVVSDILKSLGIKEIDLMTNNPSKIKEIEQDGITVRKRIAIEVKPNKINKKYLQTKKTKLGHLLSKYV